MTAPAAFSLLDPAYCAKHGVHPEEMRAAMTHVAWKNHDNGSRNPKAQFRSRSHTRPSTRPSKSLDGSACSIALVSPMARHVHSSSRPNMRCEYTETPMYVKGLSLVAGSEAGFDGPGLRLHHVSRSGRGSARCLRAGRNRRPSAQLSLAEVHDCFTPTEIVLMEDLGFPIPASVEGRARRGISTPTDDCRSIPTGD